MMTIKPLIQAAFLLFAELLPAVVPTTLASIQSVIHCLISDSNHRTMRPPGSFLGRGNVPADIRA